MASQKGCCHHCYRCCCSISWKWCTAIIALAIALLIFQVRSYFTAHPEVTWVLKTFFLQSLWPRVLEDPPDDFQPLETADGQRFLPLAEGVAKMPMSGLGLCCRLGAVGEDATSSVLWFLLLGGRHLDTAERYYNHGAVGKGIQRAIKRGIPRSEIFLTTKIPPYLYGAEAVREWIPQAIKELGVEYLDLVLLHSPGAASEGHRLYVNVTACGKGNLTRCRQETWRALTDFRAQGLIREIGVSNFGPRQMKELRLPGTAPIAVNQLEYHPWIPDVHRKTVEWCHQNGVAVTAYCSVGGIEHAQVATGLEKMRAIGKRHGKTGGQVLLRWAIQKNVSVIPGTSNPTHMRENLALWDFQLSPEEMNLIDSEENRTTIRGIYTNEPDDSE
eukprot:TRINITY_DN49272_c0_g1_i1.p1 TRINITY_DN49272_c0_g1~~TRINITY_DN49272_c0_g1_i1.p1  ORF type:complete len:387 (+),score=33.11 TRINITY_DN49272_c0_g1_i1:48-1208(+)